MSLRERIDAKFPDDSPGSARSDERPRSRVITVRMPAELHERLKCMAHIEELSLNQLCVVALEEAADDLQEQHTQAVASCGG